VEKLTALLSRFRSPSIVNNKIVLSKEGRINKKPLLAQRHVPECLKKKGAL